MGPVAPGQYRFVFQADPPNFTALPSSDIVGVTIILLTCSYKNQEFLRVGYYVNNEYVDEQMREEPPAVPVLDKLMRSILSDKPRVTKYPIDWEGNGIVAGGSGAVDAAAGGSGAGAAGTPRPMGAMQWMLGKSWPTRRRKEVRMTTRATSATKGLP